MTTEVNKNDDRLQQAMDFDPEQSRLRKQQREIERSKGTSLFGWIKRLLILAAVLYLAILVTIMFNETYLVYPGSDYPKGNWQPANFDFEEVKFDSADGTQLFGWYLPKPAAASGGPGRTVLVCHGNAENISESSRSNGDLFRKTLGADVFEFDYRGYGKCKGTPNEAGVLADSEAALKWICERTGKQPNDIILVGHSLGGGPAVHLAAKFGCRMLVLQRTYSTIQDAAANQYPWLPIKLLMRNHYPSAEKIKTCNYPLFQSHGEADQLIPFELGKQLFENSPAKLKELKSYPRENHWFNLPESYWSELADFVDKAEQAPFVQPTATE